VYFLITSLPSASRRAKPPGRRSCNSRGPIREAGTENLRCALSDSDLGLELSSLQPTEPVLMLWEKLSARRRRCTLRPLVLIRGHPSRRDGLAQASAPSRAKCPNDDAVVALIDGDTVIHARPWSSVCRTVSKAVPARKRRLTTNEVLRSHAAVRLMREWQSPWPSPAHTTTCARWALSAARADLTGRPCRCSRAHVLSPPQVRSLPNVAG